MTEIQFDKFLEELNVVIADIGAGQPKTAWKHYNDTIYDIHRKIKDLTVFSVDDDAGNVSLSDEFLQFINDFLHIHFNQPSYMYSLIIIISYEDTGSMNRL